MFAMARFVGVTRPGYELTRRATCADPTRVTLVEVPAMAISSSDCRQRVRDEPADLVPGARRCRPVHRQARLYRAEVSTLSRARRLPP